MKFLLLSFCHFIAFGLLFSNLSYAGSCFSKEVSPNLEMLRKYFDEAQTCRVPGVAGFALDGAIRTKIRVDLSSLECRLVSGEELRSDELTDIHRRMHILKTVHAQVYPRYGTISVAEVINIIDTVDRETPLDGLPLLE